MLKAKEHGNITVKDGKKTIKKIMETLNAELFKIEYERFPSEIGIIVNNATTAIYFSEALRTGKAVTHRIVTISGEGVENPQNVYVPIGTPVNYIIQEMGGYTKKYEEIADELKISVNTVKYHIKNALASIQLHMGDYLKLLILYMFWEN